MTLLCPQLGVVLQECAQCDTREDLQRNSQTRPHGCVPFCGSLPMPANRVFKQRVNKNTKRAAHPQSKSSVQPFKTRTSGLEARVGPLEKPALQGVKACGQEQCGTAPTPQPRRSKLSKTTHEHADLN